MAGHDVTDLTDEHDADNPRRKGVVVSLAVNGVDTTCHHVAGFYSDDRRLLADLTQFVGAALKAGNAAIVVATESHRDSLLPRLQAYGLDVGAAIEQGRYVGLDAAETLSAFMVNDLPDPGRFLELLGDLIVSAREAAKGEHHGGNFSDSASGFNPIQCWKTHVQQDQVWLQFLGLPNCFQSV